MRPTTESYHLYYCEVKLQAYTTRQGNEDWKKEDHLQTVDAHCYLIADNNSAYGVADLLHNVFYPGSKLVNGQMVEEVIRIKSITYQHKVTAIKGLLPSPEKMALAVPVDLSEVKEEQEDNAHPDLDAIEKDSRSLER